MIRRLKIRFTALALTALFVLLAVIVAGMNLLNYRSVVEEADTTLSLLSRNQGAFPEFREGPGGPMDWLPPGMSPELPFTARFFSVLVNNSGEVVNTETSRIFAIDSGTASRYALDIAKKGSARGFVEKYRYMSTPERMGMRITFLDCGRELDLYHDFTLFSIGMSLAGYAVTAVAVCFFAGKFIRPVAESYEKQKRFITDAGHEIRTPLTIISANVDVLKMDMGENQCLEDIGNQAKRLAGLTNDLVCLARMEESRDSRQMIEFPVSEVVLDTAAPFRTPAQTQEKEFDCQVQPMLTMVGNNETISQLVSILLDNALKYSPRGGRISLQFGRQGRRLVLTVSNPSVLPVTDETLRHVFDRFYRADSSRNSGTDGYGIGLSMARAIVNAHGGKISASLDGNVFLVTAVFPLQTS